MKYYAYKNATLIAENEDIVDPVIGIHEGKIHVLRSLQVTPFEDENIKEFHEPVYIIPGFIDLHIHGVENVDVMDGTETALDKMRVTLPKEGTTSFLPTTMTQSIAAINRALKSIRHAMGGQPRGATILGVNLEGPFISPKRAGAQPLNYILPPNRQLFHKFQRTAENAIKLTTLAPEEQDGLHLMKELKKCGVLPSLGHSNATYLQAKEAIDAGASQATHLFNGMRGLHHREAGIAGAVLLHDQIKAELIVDGLHVSPEMVQLVYKNKGPKGIILITDSMRAKGLKDGIYSLGGQEVTVKNKRAALKDGTLAGSTLFMNEAVKNMMRFSGCSLREAIQMATENPAKQLHIFDEKGSLREGKDGDFVVINDAFQVKETYVSGEKVFG